MFLAVWGRTYLRKCLPRAKFDEEADFDVRSAVGPPKPHQIDENLTFQSENFAIFFFAVEKRNVGNRLKRVLQVSGQSEPYLRGKRSFKV